jgi:hypothetical protein
VLKSLAAGLTIAVLAAGCLERSRLSPKARNREIDHAVAAVATSCDQCFQMLEAIRPIPQIAGH